MIQSLALSPDGKRIATSGYEAGAPILIREVPSRKLLLRLSEDYWGSGSLAWSPDGRVLAAGSARDATIRLWETTTGTRLHLLKCAAYPQISAIWNPVVVDFTVDGKTLLSVDSSGMFQFWDYQTGAEMGRFKLEHKADPNFAAVRRMAVSPDGKLAAVAMIAGRI